MNEGAKLLNKNDIGKKRGKKSQNGTRFQQIRPSFVLLRSKKF